MDTQPQTGNKITVEYNDTVVRYFMLASIIFGVVGMLAGVIIASQLNYWRMNFGMEWLTFGRLRPLHTNAAIFAFVGNMMFAGIYHSTQRLVKARLASDLLSWIHFWGWQLIIVAAAITLPLGFSQGKEYAELIWPIDIAVAVIWVLFGVNFIWTLLKRREPTIYVAIWFYIATIVTVALLYVVNNLHIPTSPLHSYTIFAGVQDGLVQWWYGHNAVAFFLTTPILGIMYYYVPKAANRPVYSYRLSVVHFWSLVFIYIWAGPHHLLNTALPHWLQALGMLFSLMLWAPSWGGMLNGLLTLRGAWHKLREDPVLKFLAAGVTFYGMSTFEGPLLSIRAVNYLSHYSDWTIGHVHSGTLGWNGFMAAGMFYYMAPRLWDRKLHSEGLANMHFWLGLFGILLYIAAMWVSGITQGLMLNELNEDGTVLKYQFLETLNAIRMPMLFRLIGGGLYLVGWLMLVYNIGMTIVGAKPVNGVIEVYEEKDAEQDTMGAGGTFVNAPIIFLTILVLSSILWIFGGAFGVLGQIMSFTGMFGVIAVTLYMIVHFKTKKQAWVGWYDKLIANAIPFTILTFIAVAIGGAVQIIPTLIVNKDSNVEDRLQIPYTPLELAGRDIYVSEGCYNCHSQMIRTIVPDVLRYGRGEPDNYSRIGESIYDHPFQYGSKRTGPDLAREGGDIATGAEYMRIGLRNNTWHYRHFMNPRDLEEDSNMPAYTWLETQKADWAALPGKIRVQRLLGVPYPEDWTEEQILEIAQKQADEITADLAQEAGQISVDPKSKVVALIAYIQKLGAYEEVNPSVASSQ